MKIIDITRDLWEDKKIVFGDPVLNLSGYARLDLITEHPQGVCRNIADDIASKMNKINPDYNARTMFVNMSGNDGCLDINREFSEEAKQSSGEESSTSIFHANHVVVAFNMPGYKETFIVDPTNPSFGMICNGKIINFNSLGLDDPITYKYRKTIRKLLGIKRR